jgi:hypothetical protein
LPLRSNTFAAWQATVDRLLAPAPGMLSGVNIIGSSAPPTTPIQRAS